MAREIITSIWCDPCLKIDDVRTEGEELPPITIGNGKPRVLAMCKQHRTDFYDPFVDAVMELGTISDHLAAGTATKRQTSSGTPRVVCPYPGCGVALKNVSSTQSHVRHTHGTTVFELLGYEGQLYDVNGDAVERPAPRATVSGEPSVKRAECDVKGCGKVYEFPETQRPVQALAVHKAKSHGVAGTKSAKARKARKAAATQ